MLVTRFDPMRDFKELEEKMVSAFRAPSVDVANLTGFSPQVNTREGGICLSCRG